jgi:hypothetical protein
MSEFLDTHRATAEDLLDEALPFLLTGKLRYDGLLRFCESYRIKGIVHVLLDGRPDRLHVNLHNSGRSFRHGLFSLPSAQIVVSRALPLFDATASNDVACASAIARALPTGWKRDVEYEDDYLYFSLFGKWVLSAPPAEREDLLERLAALADEADPRLAAMRALSKGDADSFDTAVDAVSTMYQQRLRQFAGGGKISDEAADTLPFFCAEGLALIRLAEREGLSLRPEHMLVPSMVRPDFSSSYGENDWRLPRAP